MKRKRKLVFFACGALVLAIAWIANEWSGQVAEQKNISTITELVSNKEINTKRKKELEPEKDAKPEQQQEKIVISSSKSEDKKATILSFGDTLCHSQVFKAVYNADMKDYDFSPMFQYIKKYFKHSTVNIGNLESSFGGAERGYSGYPLFNAPEHLAIDLKELGVDILTTANNHTLDMGFDGLCSTLNYLDEAGISHTGTANSKKNQKKILFRDLNGIKTAFLAFTYGTNGIPIPNGKDFCVNLMDKTLMKKQIKKAKKEGAEAIVVSMHWGIEYQTIQNTQQEELAEFLIKNDVNVILGCHPHVLQQMKMITTKEKGKTQKGLVIYSQGNFFSAQTYPNTRNTALFKIELKKEGLTNEVSVTKAKYIPIYVYDTGTRDKNRYKLLDLNAIIKDYENKNKKHWSEEMYQLALTEKKRCQDIIGPAIDNSK